MTVAAVIDCGVLIAFTGLYSSGLEIVFALRDVTKENLNLTDNWKASHPYLN